MLLLALNVTILSDFSGGCRQAVDMLAQFYLTFKDKLVAPSKSLYGRLPKKSRAESYTRKLKSSPEQIMPDLFHTVVSNQE